MSADFRAQLIELHRKLYKRNRARINASVVGYTPAFRAYERQYEKAVRTFQKRATFEELDKKLAAADLIYVGDYHTLKQAQRGFVRLLRRIPDDRPLIVALEFMEGRQQPLVDKWLRGEISDDDLAKGAEASPQWALGGWPSFKQIFELAKERGARVVAIDLRGRGAAGKSLVARDQYAARRIAHALAEAPNARVMTLVGELHISPDHLPRQVDAVLAEKHKRLLIYQSAHEIYWQLAEKGREQDIELVRIAADAYALLGTTPIIAQQSFLNWVDVDPEEDLESPEENFKEYCRVIGSFFGIPLGSALDDVEVTTVVNLSFLDRLRRRGDFSAADMRRIKQQILNSESYFIPRAKMVYLGKLSINHAAEEATHYIRYICTGTQEPALLIDAFYARCMEEAIGFLGSKLLNHRRKAPSIDRLRRSGNPADRVLGRAVAAHAKLEAGEKVRNMRAIYEADVELFNAITHVIGYRLGERLYYGLVGGDIAKDQIRDLFYERFEEEGSALTTFFYLVAQTRAVKVPDRL